MQLSVVTCTYNPRREVLARVLVSLRAQTLPVDAWEFVIVDNNSTPALAGELDLSWHPHARVVREREQGLTPARLRGVRETSGSLILFIDDDMLPAPDYFQRVLDLFRAHSFIGALGGTGTAEYEVPLAPWMDAFRFMWLDHSRSPDRLVPFQYAMARQSGPWIPLGAGMAVRREVAVAYAEVLERDEFRRRLDRSGGSLCGSGDADLAYTAIDLGLACATAADLRFVHIIPASRIDAAYLEKLLYLSNYYTARLLVHRGWKNSVALPAPSLWQSVRSALGRLRPRPPAWRCWRAFGAGYRDGLAGVPPTPPR